MNPRTSQRRRVVLTGAAGGVGRMLLPALLAESYDVVATDRARPADTRVDVVGDLTTPGFLAEISAGADAIVHLAANPDPTAPWEQLRGPNVEAVTAVLDTDVPRVVLASSAHAMGQYLADGKTPVDPSWPPAPCCRYGATKAFGEALGRMSAYRSGRTVVALRLGATTRVPMATSALGGWLGPADLHQLVRRALTADVRFDVCHGISANTRAVFSVRNQVGYVPVLDSEEFADEVPVDDSWGLCPGR